MESQDLIKRGNAGSVTIPMEVNVSEANLIAAFRRLPAGRQAALLEKLQALVQGAPVSRPSPEPRIVSADRLRALIGIVSLGGDALADAEALYDGDSSH